MANPLKILTALSASSGVAVSGSEGLVVQQGGLTVQTGGANITGVLTANDGVAVSNGALSLSNGGITVSSTSAPSALSGTLFVGGVSTLSGAVTAQNGLTVTGSIVTSNALSASAVSASSYIGNGSGLSSLTASQLSNFTADVRGQFSSGTGVTITNGTASIGQAVGTSDSVTFENVKVNGNITTDDDEDKIFWSGVTTKKITIGGSGATIEIPGNLRVKGTTTNIDSTTVNVGDANLALGTGSVTTADLSTANAGIDLGSGSLVQWRYSEAGSKNAWSSNVNIDVASTKSYKIAGTDVLTANTLGSGVTASSLTSVGTLSSLTVSGATKLSGAVDLGDASADVVTVNGQLTASQGLDLGANTKITVNTNDLVKKYTNSGGGSSLTGTIFKDAFGSTGTDTFISINRVSSSNDGGVEYNQVDITADNTALGASAQLILDTQAIFKVNTSAGQHRLAFDGTGTGSLTAPGVMSVDAGGGGVVYLGGGSDTVKVRYNEGGGYFGDQISNGYINVNAALVALSSSIGGGGVSAGSVETSYRQLRTFGKGIITGSSSPANRVIFVLSGSGTGGAGTANVTLKGLHNMSSGSADGLLQVKAAAISFDVALFDGATKNWTNDLVSVYITASQGANGDTNFYPKFIIDAPGASDQTEIRLIAVNENPDDFAI